MDDSIDNISEETLRALELRLRRIEFVLAGSVQDPVSDLYARRKAGGREATIKARLAALERDLALLLKKSPTVKAMLELRLYPISAPQGTSTDGN